MTRCSLVEVIPQPHKNCTEEIPMTVNETDAFVDPISYVIKSAGSPIHCNDVAPPAVQGRGQVILQLPRAQGVSRPQDAAGRRGPRIDPVKVNDIDLGKSIYTKEQLEEFARFQDSQGTRNAYLAETAEMAYTGRNEKGEWGLALSSAAQGSLIDIVWASFFLLYVQGCGANDLFSVTPATGVGRATVDDHCPAKGNNNSKMQGVPDLGVNGLLGDPLPAGNLALQLGGRGDGGRGSEGRPDDGDQDRPRAGGWGDEEEKHELRGLKEEVFMVAKQAATGRKGYPTPSTVWRQKQRKVLP